MDDSRLTPLEAMASGKPVIAVDEGGFRETVAPQAGVLVGASRDIIIDAVTSLSVNPESFHHACIERAKEFDLKIFTEKISSAVNDAYSTYQRTVSLPAPYQVPTVSLCLFTSGFPDKKRSVLLQI